jgi:hypothetical protein
MFSFDLQGHSTLECSETQRKAMVISQNIALHCTAVTMDNADAPPISMFALWTETLFSDRV